MSEETMLTLMAENRRLMEQVRSLETEITQESQLRDRLISLLDGVAIVLKGEPPPLTLHGWHDLPELAEKIKKRVDSLETAIKDFLCECALTEKLRKYETYQITTGSMDELRKAVD